MERIEQIGGRKFILALFSLVAGLLTHALSPKGLSPEVVALVVGVLGTFSAANTIATVKAPVTTEQPAIEPASPVAIDLSPIAAEQQQLRASLGEVERGVSNIQKTLLAVIGINKG